MCFKISLFLHDSDSSMKRMIMASIQMPYSLIHNIAIISEPSCSSERRRRRTRALLNDWPSSWLRAICRVMCVTNVPFHRIQSKSCCCTNTTNFFQRSRLWQIKMYQYFKFSNAFRNINSKYKLSVHLLCACMKWINSLRSSLQVMFELRKHSCVTLAKKLYPANFLCNYF